MNLVSIMMPCRNAEPYLQETITSLISQGEYPWELIVVNDGSTDNSMAKILHHLPAATIVEGERRGIGAALNLALPHAKGDFYAWIDADDLWANGKLALQLDSLRTHPHWDGCFVGAEQFFHAPEPAQIAPSPSGRLRGALLIRRQSFEKVGPFREDIKIAEFVDWCARAEDTGLQLGQLPQNLYRRRIHATNTMKSQDIDKRDYLKVLKAALDRRRSENAQTEPKS